MIRNRTALYWITAGYTLLVGGLVWYIYETTKTPSDEEAFAAADNTQCFKCMTYFREVFQYNDTTEILPFIQRRGDYLQYVLDRFLDFVQNRALQCPNAKTGTDIAGCFNDFAIALSSQCLESGVNPAECSIINTFATKLSAAALECNSKTCSIQDYRANLEMQIRAELDELRKCRAAFAKDDDLCTQLYATVMKAKGQTAPNAVEGDKTATLKDIDKRSGEMVNFVMTMN